MSALHLIYIYIYICIYVYIYIYIYMCVCVCVCVTYEDTNLYNDMGMKLNEFFFEKVKMHKVFCKE